MQGDAYTATIQRLKYKIMLCLAHKELYGLSLIPNIYLIVANCYI